MKMYTIDDVQNKLIGEIGSPERDMFENELQKEQSDSTLIQPLALSDEDFADLSQLANEPVGKDSITFQEFDNIMEKWLTK